MDGLAECKSIVADKSKFADGSRAAGMIELADESRVAGKVEIADGSRAAGKVNWELSVAAIGCTAKDSSSDFLPTLGTASRSNWLLR